jgi:hypothetical protein
MVTRQAGFNVTAGVDVQGPLQIGVKFISFCPSACTPEPIPPRHYAYAAFAGAAWASTSLVSNLRPDSVCVLHVPVGCTAIEVDTNAHVPELIELAYFARDELAV